MLHGTFETPSQLHCCYAIFEWLSDGTTPNLITQSVPDAVRRKPYALKAKERIVHPPADVDVGDSLFLKMFEKTMVDHVKHAN